MKIKRLNPAFWNCLLYSRINTQTFQCLLHFGTSGLNSCNFLMSVYPLNHLRYIVLFTFLSYLFRDQKLAIYSTRKQQFILLHISNIWKGDPLCYKVIKNKITNNLNVNADIDIVLKYFCIIVELSSKSNLIILSSNSIITYIKNEIAFENTN